MSRRDLPAYFRDSLTRPTPTRTGPSCEVCLDEVTPDLECLICRLRRCELHAGSGLNLYAAGRCCTDHRPGTPFGPKSLTLGTVSYSDSFKEKLREAELRQAVQDRPKPPLWQPVQAGAVVPASAKALKLAAGDPWSVRAVTRFQHTYDATGAPSDERVIAVMVHGIHPPTGARFSALWLAGSLAGAWIFGTEDFRKVGLDTLKSFCQELVAEPATLF